MDYLIPDCNCGLRPETVTAVGHIMGCARRSRIEAINHYEYNISVYDIDLSLSFTHPSR